MPTVKLEIGLRCRTLLGSGVPRLHINGFNLLGFCMQRFGRLGGGGDWGDWGVEGPMEDKGRKFISALYKTYPASRLFSSICFFLYIFTFLVQVIRIGKRERGLGRWNGVDGTGPDNFYIISLCPQSGSGWATRMMFLVLIFLDWTGEIKDCWGNARPCLEHVSSRLAWFWVEVPETAAVVVSSCRGGNYYLAVI